MSALAAQLRESGELKLEDWQLPRLEQEIGWALSQGFQGPQYAKNAPTVEARRAAAARTVRRGPRSLHRSLPQSRACSTSICFSAKPSRCLRDEPDVLASFRYRNRSLYVDETQDMNPLQFMLLRQMAGDDPDLFCVGDPNQSIYGFNGANPSLINDIVATWPDTVILDLTRNHRSTANIIAVANTLLEEGARGIEPAKDDGDVPLVRGYDTDDEEARSRGDVARGEAPARVARGSQWRCSRARTRSSNSSSSYLDAAGIPNERRGPEHSPASDLMAPELPARRLEDNDRDAVALSTIHRAKGLEFQHVAAIGWAEGQLPNYNATTRRAARRRAAPRLRRPEPRRGLAAHHLESRAQRPALPRPLALALSRARASGRRRDRGTQRAPARRRAQGAARRHQSVAHREPRADRTGQSLSKVISGQV